MILQLSAIFFIIFGFQCSVFALDSNTWISATYLDFTNQSGFDAQKKSHLIEINNSSILSLNSKWTFNSQLDFRSDQLAKDSQERFWLEPEEFYFQFRLGSWRTRLGFHREVWEGTDLLNPMDIVMTRNFSDPLDPRARAALGVYVTYDRVGNLDLVYIPYQTLPVLPAAQSYWWPRQYSLPLNTDQTTLLLPNQFSYDLKPMRVHNQALNNNFAVHYSITAGPVDLGFAFFEGANSSPALSPTLNATLISIDPQILQLRSPVEIQPEIYRVRRLATTISWSNSWFITKLASQWNQPQGELTQQVGSSRLSVLEIEKALSFYGQELNLFIEGVESQEGDDTDLALLSTLLKRGYSVGWRWGFNEHLTWLAAWYQELTQNSYISSNRLEWKLNDQWTTSSSLTLLGGKTSSPLGVYRDNSQASLVLKYYLP